jgi:hypothetical protein
MRNHIDDILSIIDNLFGEDQGNPVPTDAEMNAMDDDIVYIIDGPESDSCDCSCHPWFAGSTGPVFLFASDEEDEDSWCCDCHKLCTHCGDLLKHTDKYEVCSSCLDNIINS